MEARWIKERGQCSESDIISIISSQNASFEYYLAGYTDRYDSGRADVLSDQDFTHLLELRIFCNEQELLFTRSRIGTEFQWRSTQDDNLAELDYIDEEQYIDMNTEYETGGTAVERQDVTSLFTTVGGSYYLPLKDGENVAKVRAYIDYDENGMAYIADHRLCGFEKK